MTDILCFRVVDPKAAYLLAEVTGSYSVPARENKSVRQKGIPIGNLTSQIFANIYLNEFDRFVNTASSRRRICVTEMILLL